MSISSYFLFINTCLRLRAFSGRLNNSKLLFIWIIINILLIPFNLYIDIYLYLLIYIFVLIGCSKNKEENQTYIINNKCCILLLKCMRISDLINEEESLYIQSV